MGCNASRDSKSAAMPPEHAEKQQQQQQQQGPYHPDPALENSMREAPKPGEQDADNPNPLPNPLLSIVDDGRGHPWDGGAPLDMLDYAGERPQSPAITLYEFTTEMHLRRIEGRGNMARMHGYTRSADQFPAPPHPLDARQQSVLAVLCVTWDRDTLLPVFPVLPVRRQ